MGADGQIERRAGLVVCGVWLVPCVVSFVSTQATVGGRYAGNVASLLFAPLFVLLAVALGDWLLGLIVRQREILPGRWVFAAGLGLGAFSLGTFLVGLVVLPHALVGQGVLIVLAFLLRATTGAFLVALRRRIAEFFRARNWISFALVVIIAVLVLLNVLRAFVPPIEYDEMEYHLAAPATYARDGRISFIADNVYASFPANVEMLFLDGMILRGGVIEGLALGRLINVSLGLLAACAAGAAAAALFDRRAVLPAAAILYTWPRVNSLAIVGYVELGLMLYVALALLAAYEYRRSGGRLGYLALLGMTCGLAAGCKYPAVLFACVPAGIWVLATAGWRRLWHVALIAAVILAVVSPWLVKNTICTGNPVYPLLGARIPARSWSPRKEARWHKAHQPYGHLKPAGRAAWNAVTHRYPPVVQTAQGKEPGPFAMSLLLVVFIPLAFVGRGRAVKTGTLLGLALFCIAAWLALTHRIPRFLMPWLVPLVLINAAGAVALAKYRIVHVVLGILLATLVGFEAWATIRVRAPVLETAWLLGHLDTNEELAKPGRPSQDGDTWSYNHDSIMFIEGLPPKSRTLFYGEARTLYCTADVIAPTVFDENPLDEMVRTAASPDEIRERLRELGVTHIYVNLEELHRFQWSYAFEHNGVVLHGQTACPGDEPRRSAFPRFLALHCTLVYPALPPGAPESMLDRALIYEMSHRDRERRAPAPAGHFIYEIR